jgi:quercetin dioxygenase-like cupin family protein
MKVVHYEQVEAAPVDIEGAAQCKIRCLITPEDNAPSFSMRMFEIAPGGHTPHHTHGYEHEVFVLEGSGVVLEGNTERPLRPGTAVFVAPNELHQFRNTGGLTLKFLCSIPHPLRGMSQPCVAACACS